MITAVRRWQVWHAGDALGALIRGWTWRAIAAMVGVAPGVIHHWQRGTMITKQSTGPAQADPAQANRSRQLAIRLSMAMFVLVVDTSLMMSFELRNANSKLITHNWRR